MSGTAAPPYDPYAETVVPRAAISFPVRLPEPEGFDPDRQETWPRVGGRLEYLEGALWYMPPCGDDQQDTTADVVTELGIWSRRHPEYVVGTNEAGMKLGGDVRAADAAVWRRADLPAARTGGLRGVPPVLAVEVAGMDDSTAMLRAKAQWYLDHGVEVVWLLVPSARSVIVITSATTPAKGPAEGEIEVGPGDAIPEHSSLPELAPRVADLFRQLGG